MSLRAGRRVLDYAPTHALRCLAAHRFFWSSRTMSTTCEYVVICTGAPKRGMGTSTQKKCYASPASRSRPSAPREARGCWMTEPWLAVAAGWYHATQLLNGEIAGAKLTDVVEPWFMGAGVGSPGSSDFEAWKADAEAKGVRFCAAVGDLPSSEAPRVALIAGRAADCPALFAAAIGAGVNHIFLEKPGAPTVEAMESMARQAEAAGVPVSMGYNKNVAKYATLHRSTQATQQSIRANAVPSIGLSLFTD